MQDDVGEIYGMEDSQAYYPENDRVYYVSEQAHTHDRRSSLCQSPSATPGVVATCELSVKRSADGLRRAVDAVLSEQTSATATPNIGGRSNYPKLYDQRCYGFDKPCSLTLSTSDREGYIQHPRAEVSKLNERGTANWEYSKPKVTKVKPDEAMLKAMSVEAEQLLKDMKLRIQQTRAELSKMKSSIKGEDNRC